MMPEETILSRIEKEGMCPRPRWQFFLREGVIWTVGIASIGVGALAVAATLFEVRHAWWDAYEATHETFLTFLIDALPAMWIASLGVFTLLAYASVRYTKRGYVHSIPIVFLGIVLLNSIGGVALYAFGAGEFADEQVGVWMPFQRPLLERERTRWMMPEEGRVAGVVREMPFGEPIVWIEAVDGIPYAIDITDFSRPDRARMRVGDQMRVLGVPTTTPEILHGCVIFIKSDDVLVRAYPHQTREMKRVSRTAQKGSESSTLFARSTLCKGMKSFVRLAPQEH